MELLSSVESVYVYVCLKNTAAAEAGSTRTAVQPTCQSRQSYLGSLILSTRSQSLPESTTGTFLCLPSFSFALGLARFVTCIFSLPLLLSTKKRDASPLKIVLILSLLLCFCRLLLGQVPSSSMFIETWATTCGVMSQTKPESLRSRLLFLDPQHSKAGRHGCWKGPFKSRVDFIFFFTLGKFVFSTKKT